MAGYAVSRRIDPVAPQLAGRWRSPEAGVPGAEAQAEVATIDLVGRPLDEILAKRWAALRETWAKTTFYLFDANSWR